MYEFLFLLYIGFVLLTLYLLGRDLQRQRNGESKQESHGITIQDVNDKRSKRIFTILLFGVCALHSLIGHLFNVDFLIVFGYSKGTYSFGFLGAGIASITSIFIYRVYDHFCKMQGQKDNRQ